MTDGPEGRRRRRRLFPALAFVHVFWITALVLAGIVLLVIYLTGGFGEGAE